MDEITDQSWAAAPDPFNLAQYILQAGSTQVDKEALCILYPDRVDVWTYGALIAAVRGAAAGLMDHDLQPGDRVLLRLGNTPDFPIAYLGALAAGLVPVPTSAALTAPEVAKVIRITAPRAILHDPAVACPDAENVIRLSMLQAMRSNPLAPWHMGSPDRPGYIIFTSGTSGHPTAVVHAHRAIWARRMMFEGWYGLRADDRVLHAGAFNWTYTLGTGLMDPWTKGATALIPAPGVRSQDLPELIAAHAVSIFAAAPGVYRQMLSAHQNIPSTHLRHGLSAGEKLSQALVTQWEAATGTSIYEAFGMSECSTFISGSPTQPAPVGTLGQPQPGRRVAILGASGPLPAETPGTIAIHRSDPGLMLGYLDAPEQTAQKYQGDWFLTGDQGVMDPEGYVTYLGRSDDMMNAGGFRVSPLEVEAVLSQAPGVSGVAVTEVSVRAGVSVIAAFYTAVAPLDEADLKDYVSSRLARYRQPRVYVHCKTLPTGNNGKLLRRVLRENYEGST